VISWEDWGENISNKRFDMFCQIITYISVMLSIALVFSGSFKWWWKAFSFVFGVSSAVIGHRYLSEKSKRGLSYLGVVGLPVLIIILFQLRKGVTL
jgi:uncharacterized membrane protein YoaK (UPF0700 family)